MRAFVFACIGAIAVAIIGAIALGSIQKSADQAFSTSAVRLDAVAATPGTCARRDTAKTKREPCHTPEPRPT